MAKKKKQSLKLIRLYIPDERVRRFWMLYDLWATAPTGADNFETYRLWDFIGRCFEGGDYSQGWAIADEGIFHPYIYLLED
jgi:hypothetical protein